MDHNMERANWNALEESYDQLLYLLNALELMVLALPQTQPIKIGRASCRERV